ncbi:MAG: bifunctional phosphopantothenoylcysteine decarboxylase/phosphopantothenate--cysteine ligase CoaBC [bacterium]|nr:bifunctional phosphopantothenoylcysteine decarboxylase/phosphopantothenate--cysteine ligase CoaBC [bacterium]
MQGRVLLMITGGIAAYKACFLARLLQQAGFSVRCAMTDAAQKFVGPVTLRALTGQPVATDLWGEGQSEALDHVEYALWADLVVVAPATANFVAKAAHGIADDMVSTLLLASPCPVLVAPAMNDNMWRHPATQANCATLRERGVHLVGPGSGWLACGTVDEGRMSEPEEILQAVKDLAATIELRPDETPSLSGPWAGRRVIVTAGPTQEAIDPVRAVVNRSSGAMGYALAAAACAAGAEVTLISGPVDRLAPRGLKQHLKVGNAQEMAEAVAASLDGGCDWLLMAAAVADFRPATAADAKLKKNELGETWRLDLVRNPDILKEIVPDHRSDDTVVVGFALETGDVVNAAQAKLQEKKLDFVLANDPTQAGSGFGDTAHQVTLVDPDGVVWESESLPKPLLAVHILDRLEAARHGAGA